MKYLRYIIMLMLFIGMVYWMRKHEEAAAAESERLLHNSVRFNGVVLSVKISSNHNFGIILLKLKSTNTSQFFKPGLKMKFPYRISGNNAEVYLRVPDGIQAGDSISVDSNTSTVVYYHQNQRYEAGISMIDYTGDLDFIKENTVLVKLGLNSHDLKISMQ